MRYRQNPAAEAAPLQQGLMILEPAARKFCALNATSVMIWSRLREPATVDELADHVVEQFQGVTRADVLPDVTAIVDEMKELGIVLPVE